MYALSTFCKGETMGILKIVGIVEQLGKIV